MKGELMQVTVKTPDATTIYVYVDNADFPHVKLTESQKDFALACIKEGAQ